MAQFYFNTPKSTILKYPKNLKEKEVLSTYVEIQQDNAFFSLSKKGFYWLLFLFFILLILLMLFCKQDTPEVKTKIQYVLYKEPQYIKNDKVSVIDYKDTNISEQNLSSRSQHTTSFQPRTMNGSFPDVTSQVTTGVLDFFGDLVFGGSPASNTSPATNMQNQPNTKDKSSKQKEPQEKSNLPQNSQKQSVQQNQQQHSSAQKEPKTSNNALKNNKKESLTQLGMKLPNRVLPSKNISVLIPKLHKPVSLKKYMYFVNTTKAHYPNYIDIKSKKIILAKESHCLKKASTIYEKEACSVTGLTQKDKKAYVQWLNTKTAKHFTYKTNKDTSFQLY